MENIGTSTLIWKKDNRIIRWLGLFKSIWIKAVLYKQFIFKQLQVIHTWWCKSYMQVQNRADFGDNSFQFIKIWVDCGITCDTVFNCSWWHLYYSAGPKIIRKDQRFSLSGSNLTMHNIQVIMIMIFHNCLNSRWTVFSIIRKWTH